MAFINLSSVGILVIGVVIGVNLAKIYNIDGGSNSSSSIVEERSSHANDGIVGSKWNHYLEEEDDELVVDFGRSTRSNASSTSSSSKLTYEGSKSSSSSFAEYETQYPKNVKIKPATTTARSSSSFTTFIEEYIPPKLLPQYEPQNLQFNITKTMLRQSRPVIGNTHRLHAYFTNKLRTGQCTTILVLGGSVSAGHNVKGGEENAYGSKFVEWLNERYPCTAGTTTGTGITQQQHTWKQIRGASNSVTHMTSWSLVEAIETIDLVFIEFNVNDHFISDLPHKLEDKGPLGETKAYISLWYFEVILRRLLLLRKPDPLAIVTFNADYLGRTWAGQPWFDPEKARKTLFYYNQEPLKNWLSSMYEIPVFSASIWMLPLAGKRGSGMQSNRTANPYATANWHTDTCCHPRLEGHLILNLVLAYCMVEEEKIMLLRSGDGGDDADNNMVYEETDFTADDIPILRDPIYLSPEEEALYVIKDIPYAGVDFTQYNNDARGEQSFEKVIVANEGWMWYADNREKDKYGYIVNDITGGQHLAISLTGGKHGMVEVSYVISYENFGTALAWFDNSNKNKQVKRCNKPVNSRKVGWKGSVVPLVAIWDELASVPKVELLKTKLGEGEERVLHFCLTPRSESIALGPENKFKLLGVRVY
mmetsp:Transcript_29425/g.61397  ORF Transcript_29425/g.61397 Transcript_29425/m.61397 type:complete len:648 (+) Transcript_29425:113-2056(+)